MQTTVDPQEYWDDPLAKVALRTPSKVVPSTTIILYELMLHRRTISWRVLCHQRTDNRLWGFVGGAQEIGESITTCAIREAFEETGLHITDLRLACVDSDPAHGAIMAYPDGNVVQYTNVTFLARVAAASQHRPLQISAESVCLAWFPVDQLPEPFSPLHRWRLAQALQINQHPPVR